MSADEGEGEGEGNYVDIGSRMDASDAARFFAVMLLGLVHQLQQRGERVVIDYAEAAEMHADPNVVVRFNSNRDPASGRVTVEITASHRTPATKSDN